MQRGNESDTEFFFFFFEANDSDTVLSNELSRNLIEIIILGPICLSHFGWPRMKQVKFTMAGSRWTRANHKKRDELYLILPHWLRRFSVFFFFNQLWCCHICNLTNGNESTHQLMGFSSSLRFLSSFRNSKIDSKFLRWDKKLLAS